MARKYKPRNPFDPGSKLDPVMTLDLLSYLITGKPSKVIAQHMGVSENTVSALSARFRKNLRTSPLVRQACFELFYEAGTLGKDTYTHLLDGPDAARPGYFTDLANCIFHCPGQFKTKAADWTKTISGMDKRLLNMRQSQSFLTAAVGNGTLLVRRACENCSSYRHGPIKNFAFHVTYERYLRERNFGMKHVEDYYLLFMAFYLLHMTSIQDAGVTWADDEIHLPNDSLEGMQEKYLCSSDHVSFCVVQYMGKFIQDDPLE